VNVLRTRSARRAVDQLDRQARRRYDSAVEELRGRGCAAGGYRLLGHSGENYALCCRYFYGQWRMHLAFPNADTVVIVSVAKHTPGSNPHEALAEIFPGLSATGRRRSDKPPCCEDSGTPPPMSEDARAVLEDVFSLQAPTARP
jgi:hypothetical protein